MTMEKRKKKVPSEFVKWFVLQFGSRPYALTSHEAYDELSKARCFVNNLENKFLEIQDWECRFDAAFKSWLAKEELSHGE
jgi:hypothetical protein